MKPLVNRFIFKNLIKKDLNGSFVFIAINFILSLAFIYYFDGFIIKKYIIVVFINSIFLAFMENGFRINHLPDNFNINIFGVLFVLISLLIDFKLRISTINLVFGLLICFIFTIVIVLLDIIKLKNFYKYYLVFLLIYASLGYHLFLFNLIILTGMGAVKKINIYFNRHIHYFSSFVELDEIRDYFLLTIIIVFIYFIIPHRIDTNLIKVSLVIGLITGLLHYLNEQLGSFLTKNRITIKKTKLSPELAVSREIITYNSVISLGLLLTGYFFNLMGFLPLISAFLYINLFLFLYLILRSKDLQLLNTKYNKFFIVYFAFKIHFLLQLL
ncbi:MAG: hypothetical protein KKH98_00880 [Spirochaetes bacterium]|nr:hypothetical protein [Spirochaetota bacterium]